MVDYTNAAGYVVDAKGRRQFQDRDIANGIDGTSLIADDLNQDRNALVDLVAAAGMTPDASDETQVTQAVQYFGKKAASGMVSGSPGVLASGDVAGAILYYSGAGNAPAFIYGNQTAFLLTNSALNGYATQAWANGLFATITQLQAEIKARSDGDTALADSKANVSGGNNLSGSQNISKGNVTLVGDTDMGAASYQNIIQRGDAWRYAFDYMHDNDHGNYSRLIFYDGDTQNVLDILYYFLDRGRLSSAMHGDYALVSDFGVSLASNGYQKLPGGLIIQWGVISSSNGTFNFPITFPNGCFFVLPGNTNAQGSSVDNAYAYPLNASEFFAATKESQGSNAISGFAMAWIAFGY